MTVVEEEGYYANKKQESMEQTETDGLEAMPSGLWRAVTEESVAAALSAPIKRRLECGAQCLEGLHDLLVVESYWNEQWGLVINVIVCWKM